MKQTTKNNLFCIALLSLFVLAPLYYQPNGGGVGLELTYNIATWFVACWIITIGIIIPVINKKLFYPVYWLYLLVFPVVVLVISLITGSNQPIAWFFRQCYIFGGLFFLFALFQFRLSQKVKDKSLYILVLAVVFQALLSILQTHTLEWIPDWLSSNIIASDRPMGNFQQINVNATFLATGLIIMVYLISRPSFIGISRFKQVLLVASFSMVLYVIVLAGSRAALLAIILSVPLVIISRYRYLIKYKLLMTSLLILSCVSILLARSGLESTIDKTTQIYASARIHMYEIGYNAILGKPISGYGIGNFVRTWTIETAEYISSHTEAIVPAVVTHPHNELLFWMIEGGLASASAILIFIIGLCIALSRCGFSRGAAYAAMLLPISLHTQVELPFYISSVHWFLWLFLIYLVMDHKTKSINVNLSAAATMLIKAGSVVFLVSSTTFLVNTARAQADLVAFQYDKNLPPPYLQLAMNNLYYRPAAEEAAMTAMFHESLRSNNREGVLQFEQWARMYVETMPYLWMYQELILASKFLRPELKGCDAITVGFEMYRHIELLEDSYKQCSLENLP